ncbi:DUF4259 domain-containing protein [uncultured Cellulomonas sp.]|uniref:DUF4259 domain-containing protein n=1 Tax=uncultured Cellulomonas sp. TaxID=189682 RepID=UPI002602961F|nr:DUF4259 domain-containing protein [uncultured Cellulomonas sp.]
MGTWGTGPFDNDTAADWAGDFEEADVAARPAMIRDALAAAADAEDYLDADDAMAALAAAALVSAAQANGPQLDDNYGPDAAALEGLDLGEGLRVLAVRAVTRVFGADSEWRELWEDAGELGEARTALEPILSALRDTAGGAS